MQNAQETLHRIYSQAEKKDFGSSKMTVREFSTLRTLYYITREQLFGRVKNLTQEDSQIVKSTVFNSIVENGWPTAEKVSTEDLSEAAINHACVVAEHLLKTRGEEATSGTFFSYTTKNQFDRFVATLLLRDGRIKKGGKLYHGWYDPQERQPDYQNPAVKYPESTDATRIYGIAKPNRYWPAQLMRHIEAVRLKRASLEELKKLKVGETDVKNYSIPWIDFGDIIANAQTIDDIAVGVAIKTMSILHERGLTADQIIELILVGYSPGGPVNEHGKIPQVGQIWKRILNEVKASSNLKDFYPLLEARIKEKMREINYPFD